VEKKKRALFKNGKIIDGTGRCFEQGCLVIEEGTIVHISGAIDPSAYREHDVIDVYGKTILPGLIDCHVHLLFDAGPDHLALIRVPPPLLALRGAVHARKTIESGITTVRDMGGREHIDLILRDAIRSGLIPGPRMLCAGKVITMTGGHSWPIGIEADGAEEVRKAVRSEIKAGVDFIKFMSTGGVGTPGTEVGAAQLTEEELHAGIEEAHRFGKKTGTHAQGRIGIRNALRAGIDTLDHGIGLDDESIEIMIEKKIPLVPTFATQEITRTMGSEKGIPEAVVRRSEGIRELQVKSIQKAIKAGVSIAMGTDAGAPFYEHGRNILELGYLIKLGLSPMDAIQAATKVASQVLGIQDKVGTIEIGKCADLLVVEGDPLADMSFFEGKGEVFLVMKEGEVVFRKDKASSR
jgi:imidazolonepropionase-like amidohydrolase